MRRPCRANSGYAATSLTQVDEQSKPHRFETPSRPTPVELWKCRGLMSDVLRHLGDSAKFWKRATKIAIHTEAAPTANKSTPSVSKVVQENIASHACNRERSYQATPSRKLTARR
jgi:hypothetical protein